MRLPEAFRSWLRPSSALKPSHPSDGVACRVFFAGVCFTFEIGSLDFLCMVFIVSMKASALSHLHFFASDFEIESGIYFFGIEQWLPKLIRGMFWRYKHYCVCFTIYRIAF
jgi:hypothetical protein